MKRIIVLFFVLINYGVFAQNEEYSIFIKDIETQMPIENATVIIMKTRQILLTNEEGKVNFKLTGGSNVQTFISGYEAETVRWATLKQNEFIIYLKSKNSKLDEIILSKESPQKILQKVVSNSIKKMEPSYRLKVFVREFFLLDDKYSYYNDGLVHFQFATNQKKIFTTLLVEQNRSYGLIDSDVSDDLKGYNLNNIMENYCSFKYFQPIIDSKAKKEYYYIIKRHPTNKNYYVMSIAPLEGNKKAVDNFEITYDPEQKIIIGFTVKANLGNIAKIEKTAGLGTKKITRSFVRVDYRLDGTDYYLLKSNEETAYDIVLKDKIKSIEVRNSFITTNFNKQKFSHKEADVFKEKSLFNKKNNILTNYWDISGFTATDEEKAIIQSLEYKM
ncbi:hypothetical protein [Flavobacterium eburneipallidum]|uniref:hypothetical protein n=1 Tax=Flavobacterium eburneipallidum TaxID=3003263 RepID=UPI0024829361|nr:hypothetical protein [Flavobacterium eburneipallidum]